MKSKTNVIGNHHQAFITSLMDIRMKMAPWHGVGISLALGVQGSSSDYILAGIYIVWNLLGSWISFLKNLLMRPLRYLVLGMDVIFTAYMIARTGGAESRLYPFLFLPVVAAAIRGGYICLAGWCTLMAGIYVTGAYFAGSQSMVSMLLGAGYLYMAGFFAGFLVHHTYLMVEEVSTKALVRKNNDLQRLNHFLKEISKSSDVNQILAETLKTIHEHSATPMAAVMIFDMQGKLRIADEFGWEKNWIDRYHEYPLTRYSLTLAPILVFKKPLLCSDIYKHTELIHAFAGTPVKSLFAYPLIIEDETIVGAVVVADYQVKNISEEESQIMVSITHQASIALQNAIQLEQEKRKADTDGLTGLYNRRYFNEIIEDAVRRDRTLSLIMIDVDNFKKYNDTFGHPAGDQLLKKVAGVIVEAVREGDIVARYGGEEMAVILRNCANALAMQIAESIRRSVEQLKDVQAPVTVSLGVATLPQHAVDVKGLIEYADKSLYEAKHTGKNRVCCGWAGMFPVNSDIGSKQVVH
ncbi:MAG TPA: sensor domain-containing diguanylate cyclase [Bacillota bacterium]|nr:sensor domain-containing diguanylate cyclase [Bacillota bacterium]HPT88026.1 sensor domain-containing diguanylate cyclase [Bacillota bacterium]